MFATWKLAFLHERNCNYANEDVNNTCCNDVHSVLMDTWCVLVASLMSSQMPGCGMRWQHVPTAGSRSARPARLEIWRLKRPCLSYLPNVNIALKSSQEIPWSITKRLPARKGKFVIERNFCEKFLREILRLDTHISNCYWSLQYSYRGIWTANMCSI